MIPAAMNGIDVAELVSRIRQSPKLIDDIARESAVPKETLKKLLRKTNPVRNSRIETLNKLVKWLNDQPVASENVT
jgi:hypothetical protein